MPNKSSVDHLSNENSVRRKLNGLVGKKNTNIPETAGKVGWYLGEGTGHSSFIYVFIYFAKGDGKLWGCRAGIWFVTSGN